MPSFAVTVGHSCKKPKVLTVVKGTDGGLHAQYPTYYGKNT